MAIHIKLNERAVAIGEKVYGPDNPTVAIRVTNLAGVFDTQGDLKEAKELYEKPSRFFRKAWTIVILKPGRYRITQIGLENKNENWN